MNRLLSIDNYEHVFVPLQGKRVGFVKMFGNVGDRLIDWATEQLFDEFGIVYGSLNWWEGGSDVDQVLWDADTIVIAGGGNLGGKYDNCRQLRKRYIGSGKPITILPQSLTDLDEELSTYASIYLREQESVDLYPDGILAPDLALGFTPPDIFCEQDIYTGIFIREDSENEIGYPKISLGDPALICDSVVEYLSLAARCKTIYTDRVHFAICGLIAGCEVHLLPCNYHKNRSMYCTWLKDQGCYWCEKAEDLPEIDPGCVDDKFKSLALPKSRRIPWIRIPVLEDDIKSKVNGDEFVIWSDINDIRTTLSTDAERIINAIDGKRTVEQVCQYVGMDQSQPMVEVARDVQFILKILEDAGVLKLVNGGIKKPPSRSSGNPGYIELCVEPAFIVGDNIRYQATIREKGDRPKVIWFEMCSKNPLDFSPMADPFVLASLLPSMLKGLSLHVSGRPVSAGLLKNLYEFQMIFSAWYPELNRIEIHADELDLVPESNNAIAAFSGGVDSTFTILRQLRESQSSWNFGLTAALVVRGFDIYISSPQSFNLVLDRAKSVLGVTKCKVIAVNTNVREVYSEWRRAHGLCIAAALSLFNNRFSVGMLASTIPYKMLYPFGSNAITDRLLGSNKFRVIHDGAEFERIEKLRYLAGFPKAISNLRFCFVNRISHQNCGKCEKCVITAIMLTALDLPLDCFDNTPDTDQFRKVFSRIAKTMQITHLEFHDLFAARNEIKKNGYFPEWFHELDDLVERTKIKAQQPRS